MYGAILGDIIGSRFEFDRGGKTKEFELFTSEDTFTDDSVMTIAVGHALLNVGKDASIKEIKNEIITYMKFWGRQYPNAGYGGRFFEWLFYYKKPRPYGSYGNGSAMRVSSVSWLYDSLERTRVVARASAEVTHNHPEGIKGADCTASVIYLSRTGKDKEFIKEFVVKEFGYDLSESLEQLRARHKHIETCMDSLPKALVSFFEGNSYEDVVRNAVSLGGDTDTLAAIAGAMAEAYYGIPVEILGKGSSFIPKDMLEILSRFDMYLGRFEKKKDPYENNKYIKLAIEHCYKEDTKDSMFTLLQVLLKRIEEDGEAPTPMVDKNKVLYNLDISNICIGDSFTLDQDLRLTIDTMQDTQGNLWIPLFTDTEELHKQETTNFSMNLPILDIMKCGLENTDVEGVVINPFGQALTLTKPILRVLMKQHENL